MAPPEALKDGTPHPGAGIPAVPFCLTILKNRREFLRAAQARRHSTPGIMVQARQRQKGEAAGMRVGFTCSKKVGNAVTRNRAKRRLRDVARRILPVHGRDGWDYVLIGRAGTTVARPFHDLQNDLIQALSKLHR